MINKDNTVFVGIDFQEKLVPAMEEKEDLLGNLNRVVKCMDILEIPMIFTQQYTKGIGETVPEIKDGIKNFSYIEKNTFDCLLTEAFNNEIMKHKGKTIIIAGIEAHICVEQTVLSLLKEGFDVIILANCIASRNVKNKYYSIRQM
jgi:nicotinamidase-related amidase